MDRRVFAGLDLGIEIERAQRRSQSFPVWMVKGERSKREAGRRGRSRVGRCVLPVDKERKEAIEPAVVDLQGKGQGPFESRSIKPDPRTPSRPIARKPLGRSRGKPGPDLRGAGRPRRDPRLLEEADAKARPPIKKPASTR